AKALADQELLEAKLRQADRDLRRVDGVRTTRTVTQQEIDTTESAFDIARADSKKGISAIEEARANLEEAQKNCDYTKIISPVKGVIIDRRVNVGQTVVASLNAPSLFLIAKDLSKLQIWVQVNEADIGQIRDQGQEAYRAQL